MMSYVVELVDHLYIMNRIDLHFVGVPGCGRRRRRRCSSWDALVTFDAHNVTLSIRVIRSVLALSATRVLSRVVCRFDARVRCLLLLNVRCLVALSDWFSRAYCDLLRCNRLKLIFRVLFLRRLNGLIFSSGCTRTHAWRGSHDSCSGELCRNGRETERRSAREHRVHSFRTRTARPAAGRHPHSRPPHCRARPVPLHDAVPVAADRWAHRVAQCGLAPGVAPHASGLPAAAPTRSEQREAAAPELRVPEAHLSHTHGVENGVQAGVNELRMSNISANLLL